MTQTETAIMIASGIMVLFGGPFFILTANALATDNQAMMMPLITVGFSLTFFCLLVLIIGAWLDGLH